MPRRALLSGSKSSLVAERFGARYLRSHWPAAARSAATSNEVAVSARLVWHCGGDLHPGQRHHDEGALQAAEPGDALPGGGWWLHHLLHHPGLRLRHLPERPLRLRHPAELRGHPAELRGHPILLNSVDYKPLDFEMQQPPTTSGSIPLQEYRRDIPPGWTPGNPGYPLKEYFEKLRLWYRVCGLEDELIGPMIAGRLYGRASKVAMALRVRRPDGAYDVGDAALVRLAVDEVVYPNTGQVIQAHIPSGVQHLVQALRNAFGQQDHDMATQALERFFSLTRGKMSLAEYAVEFDSRMDEAHDRAGLVMNDVAKFYLFFKGSGLSNKAIDDIKLQVQGDHSRFADARALALRLSPSRPGEHGGDVFYADQDEYDETVNYDAWYDSSENYWYDDYTQDYGYDDEGSWHWDGEEFYYGDADDWYDEDQEWQEEGYQTAHEDSLETNPENADEVKEEYYKGKSKGKGNNDGCFRCGSKWHMARDCPMNDKGYGKSGGKGSMKGKSKGKFKGGWRWRPNYKGSYKGKGKGKGKKGGYKGSKGYGKTNWYVHRPPLDAYDGIPSNVPRQDNSEEFNIHTPPDAEDFMSIPRSSTRTRSTSDGHGQEHGAVMPEKRIHEAFSFAFSNYYQATDYFMVRGQKRRGLIIDPGAASGLIGSETLRDLVATCVKPFGKEISIEKDVTSPVSGIDGKSDQTLGRVTVPLLSSGKAIKFCGEVIGGQGSLCPALVGNPSLRKMNCVIFSNYFSNGDGLLAMNHKEEPQSSRLLRLLLTDSGHYILATDGIDETKITKDVQKETYTFCSKVLSSSIEKWPESEINPRLLHVFAVTQAGGNRCEERKQYESRGHREQQESSSTDDKDNGDKAANIMDKSDKTDTNATVSHESDGKLNLDKNNHDAAEAVSQPGILPAMESTKEPIKHNVFSSEPKLCGPTSFPTTTEELPKIVKKVHFDDARQPASLEAASNNVEEPSNKDEKDSLDIHYKESDFPVYTEDMLPDGADHAKLKKRYKAIKEEFYTQSGHRPVTPSNFRSWMNKSKGRNKRWHFWEIFSGSGRLSLTLLLSGLAVGPPIDMRYGWDVNNTSHQAMLLEAQREFKPGTIHYAPDCAPWSVSSSSKDPALRHQDRLHDLPALNFVQNSCEEQSREGRGYTVEQPYGSAMMDEGLRLDRIPDCKKKQRVDQCMHGAVSELGDPVQKATALIGNIKYNKTALRCSGHQGQPHAHLQGQTCGHNRTTLAAVYPKQMCQRMRQDIIKYLHSRDLMRVKTENFYECVRCTLGRFCPKGIDHTMIPGQCRHGRYAAGTNPRLKSTSSAADPITDWKKAADREALDVVQLDNELDKEFNVKESHYLKKLLIESVNNALGLFTEASNRKIDYTHWIDNPVAIALFKELFKEVMQVKAIKVLLRPFRKSSAELAEPHLSMASGYLRLFITGGVKHWKVLKIEDMREFSFSQINEAIDEDDWVLVLYGVELDSVPAPSTPSARPRAIPAQPALPPRRDDAALVPVEPQPQIQERPDDEREEEALAIPAYEEFEAHGRAALAPVKPNYNLRRVLERLPKLVD